MFNDHLYFYLLNKHPSLRNLRERERERETERETGRERQRETERGRDRPVFLCPKQTQQAQKPHLATISLTSLSRQNRERERETDRQTDRQTETERDRERRKEGETDLCFYVLNKHRRLRNLTYHLSTISLTSLSRQNGHKEIKPQSQKNLAYHLSHRRIGGKPAADDNGATGGLEPHGFELLIGEEVEFVLLAVHLTVGSSACNSQLNAQLMATADVGDTDVTATGRRRRDVSVAVACHSPVAAHTSDSAQATGVRRCEGTLTNNLFLIFHALSHRRSGRNVCTLGCVF